MMRILGIDPGLRLTGYGAIEWRPGREALLIDGGVIRLNAKAPIPDRLVELETELTALLQELKPEVVAVELLYSNYAHPRTAILMGHARGVILMSAARFGARIEQVAANRVKQSMTGFGHAGKASMQKAVQAYFRLPELPSPPDVADALAIALCFGRTVR
jgi:crossover junction endodeoxyribonuclease RuvC